MWKQFRQNAENEILKENIPSQYSLFLTPPPKLETFSSHLNQCFFKYLIWRIFATYMGDFYFIFQKMKKKTRILLEFKGLFASIFKIKLATSG
jgi:hypothetical protein